jgi:serine phosphatase RsbU (regulator of sigma subunit)
MLQRILFASFFVLSTSCPVIGFQNTTKVETLKTELEQALQQKNYRKASEISYEIAREYHEAKRIAEAKKALDQSITYAKKSNVPSLAIQPSYLLGSILYESRDYKNAAVYLDKSSALALAAKNELAFESLTLQGKNLSSMKRFRRAIEPIERALRLALEEKSLTKQLTCYKLLQEYYLKSGNEIKSEDSRNHYEALNILHEKELESRNKAVSLEKVVAREKETNELKLNEQKVIVAEQQEKIKVVETELKEVEKISENRQLEIDLLSKDRELANLRIQEQNTRLENEALVRNSILIVLLLVTTLVGVTIINYRKQIKANQKIELQNKNIKSSINYAKRIQEAMLPKKDIQEKYLNDSFILFKPKDVVSGDFYWFCPLKGKDETHDLAFAAIDCTGHGVPGAFMSMIGINSLNSILSKGINEVDKILEILHQEIQSALQQQITGNNDGMDAALCIYRNSTRTLQFAGAKNPLVYIQNNELYQIKGDIHSIGGSRSKNNLFYKKHEIKITEPTMVYLFSDGYRDQFGGNENQKFMAKRFSKLLLDIHHLPLEEQSNKLSQAFEKWKGHNDQTDDVLVMGIRFY